MKVDIKLFLFLLLTSTIILFFIIINLEEKQDAKFILNAEINKFNLITHNGDIFNSKILSKAPSLFFFGFLNCPDICPATLTKVSNIIKSLQLKNKRVNFYFVTVDPKRDNEKKIKEYLSHFNSNIIGVTGSPNNINDFLDYMYVYRKKVYLSEEEYTYDHSSQIFMFHKDGDFFGTISLNDDNIDIYKKIDKIINGA